MRHKEGTTATTMVNGLFGKTQPEANNKTGKPLPNAPLMGAVCAHFVKRGGKIYGPYWFRYWREGGRLRKRYVRPEELERTLLLCEIARMRRERRVEDRRLARSQRRAVALVNAMLRQSERDGLGCAGDLRSWLEGTS